MNTFKHDRVNPLVNPVSSGDCVLSETGQRFFIRQNMRGEYWLEYADGHALTHPVSGQVGICMQIAQLINL